MIGKRIILTIAGAAVLLSLSVLVVYRVATQPPQETTVPAEKLIEESVMLPTSEEVDTHEKMRRESVSRPGGDAGTVVGDVSAEDVSLVADRRALECDEGALLGQLTELLKARAWQYDMSDVTHLSVATTSELDLLWSLPFGYDAVCIITAEFSDETDAEISHLSWGLFSGGISDQKTEVTIGGVTFTPNPADGPMGTSNVLPFTVDGEGVQFLQLSEFFTAGRRLDSHEPVCPCAATYTAVLTAPMYPEEYLLRSGE